MLQSIYVFALGLVSAAFAEIGIYTFYPRPKTNWQARHSYDDSPEVQRLQTQRQEEATRKNENYWGMVSLLSLALATLLLAVALLLPRQLAVLADGLLMGGVFTLLCGAGAGIGGGGRIAKFVVACISLALTLALGYVKFASR